MLVGEGPLGDQRLIAVPGTSQKRSAHTATAERPEKLEAIPRMPAAKTKAPPYRPESNSSREF